MNSHLFNAHHSPLGAFATFTLGLPGPMGGLGLELGKPADQNVFIGLQDQDGEFFEALPFYAGADSGADDQRRFQVDQGDPIIAGPAADIRAIPAGSIQREFQVASDRWSAGDLSFAIYSPMSSAPDPSSAALDDLKLAIVPAVIAELTIDNVACDRPRRAFFGYAGSDPYTAMRHIAMSGPVPLTGIGQGLNTAILTDTPGARSGIAFSLSSLLHVAPENLAFGLGSCAAILLDVPPRRRVTYKFAVCFYKAGTITAGIEASYYYTRLWQSIDEVAAFTLAHFDELRTRSAAADALLAQSKLSQDQLFMLAHAIRSYYGSTQLLQHNDKPFWVVNEGEYRMINTLDLTIDQMFYELRMNPWTVRNELDAFLSRYSYHDTVRLPGDEKEYPGGLSFAHDMGVANVFSPSGYSSYEQPYLRGTFSYMTHEQLANWICVAGVYAAQTGDRDWSLLRRDVFHQCLQSLVHRDHPDPAERDGIMSADSSRAGNGAEITTYDSLDKSLGQARNNLYLGGKTWACYVILEKLFRDHGDEEAAGTAASQADRAARTLASHLTDEGYIPAVFEAGNDSRIIPAVEGLVFPYYAGCRDALLADGRFGAYIRALRTHLMTVLAEPADGSPAQCRFASGAWKLSSTSDNSWLSKIYLCQFVARQILGITDPAETARADAAHVQWLLDPENAYWAWTDQMLSGKAVGSKYYPRGVTAALWLDESRA